MSPRAIMMRLVREYRRELLEFGEWDRGEWPAAHCYTRRSF